MELLKNLEGLSADEQMSAVVELQKAAMKHLEEQKQASIGKSAEMVILGLKKIKSDFEAKFDSLNYDIQTKVASLKDGEQGLQGPKGEQGDRGLDGSNGRDGRDGKDGRDGTDGVDGVGVTDAKIDFDGSLVITLSDGREINVGEVVPVDVAEKIRTVHNIQSGSGGDSQTVLDAIAALQATIATYGTMATQNANNVAITGGTINNTTIGATTPSTGVFTTLTAQNETLKGTGQNLQLQSQTFTNTGTWTPLNGGTPTGNATTAPDSTNTGSSFLESVTTAQQAILENTSPIALGITYTYSVYAKASTVTAIQLTGRTSPFGSNIWANFNLSNGTVGSVGSSATASIVNAGNGWYRCIVTGVAIASATGSFAITLIDNNPSSSRFPSYLGTGRTVFLWGAQLEIGSTANTYIPTTTTAVYGTPTLSFSGVASIGLQSDGSLYETSAGTGNVRFYTNNIGQEQARVSHTASAVNYAQLTGSATGSGPIHSVAGSDANIDSNHNTKGTGSHKFNTGTGEMVRIADSSGTGFVQLSGGTTPYIVSQGSTNANLSLGSNGTGTIFVRTNGGGTTQAAVTHTASAVNYVQVTGAATGGTPTISAQGSDTNIPLTLNSKGNNGIVFQTRGAGTPRVALQLLDSGSASVNYLQIQSNISGAGPVLSALGTDTNIDLALTPKGTGNVRFGTYTGTALSISGYIEIKDSGGTVRKLAVVA